MIREIINIDGMKYKFLRFGIIDAVGVITLNNPPANGLSATVLEELSSVTEQIKSSGTVRAVLIQSDCEGFFSAGADLSLLTNLNDNLVELLPKAQEIFNKLESLPVPVVAAISGHALGGGLELALACDFRFMAKDSGRVGLPEVRLGLIPSFGGSQRLPQIVGRAKALEMMIKGLQITAEEAREIGLVTEAVLPEELSEKSMDYAKRLALQATSAISRIKQCVLSGYREGFMKGLEKEVECFGENIRSYDAKEGVEAFLSGRKPEFKGN